MTAVTKLKIRKEPRPARILLVDDEGNMLKVLSTLLQVVGHHEVITTPDGIEAAKLLKDQDFDLMITDVRMSPMSGMQLLALAHDIRPSTVVIIVTAFTSIDTATEAYDLGAFDYVPKPFKVDELLETVTMALKYRDDKMAISDDANTPITVSYYLDDIIAMSPSMKNVCNMVKQLAPGDMPVMLTGPQGSGKQMIARAIHNHSASKDKKFASLNCKELSPAAIDVELFRRNGLLQDCAGGTLFLEEADGLSPTTQTKLAGIMKDKKFRPIGADNDVDADFRLMGATTLRADEAARKGLFLADLRRVPSRVTIEIPALRDRAEDILPLACHFLKTLAPDGQPPALSGEVCEVFASYSWGENADQLAATIKNMLPLAKDGVIRADILPIEMKAAVKQVRAAANLKDDSYKGKNLMKFIRKKRREQVRKVVDESGGDRRRAAKAMNISLVDLNLELDEPLPE